MQDSKLIEVLRTLNSRELTRFSEYVHSPYYNKHQQLQQLCVYLLKLAPDFDSESKLDKYRIYTYLYPKGSYDDAMLHSLFSKLLRLLYDFLATEFWQEERRMQEVLLLRQLRHRKVAEKHVVSATRRFGTLEAPNSKERALLYWEDFLFHRELDLEFLGRGGRTYNEHLQAKNDALDLCYIAEKFKIACDMVSRSVVTQAHYTPSLLAEIQGYVAQQPHLIELPILAIYWCIYQTLTEPQQNSHYERLKGLLRQHHSQFCNEEAMDMYGYALNYCIRKINQGQIEFYEEIWTHYQLLVDAKIIYLGDYLPPWEYKNIVTTALRLGKYDWAKQFVEKYRADLPPDIRENAYRYNLASIYYAVRDYEKALRTLHDVEFTDATYHLGAKIIQLKSYYELHEGDALRSLIDAFQVYLRRSKEISEYRKDANAQFLRLTKKIYQYREQILFAPRERSQAKFDALLTEVNTAEPLANKDWLLQILQELSKK